MSASAEVGPFVARVVERGVLTAHRTITFNAPSMRRGGSSVQILEMVAEGTIVEPGDLIVRFDSAALEEQIQQREVSVARSEAQLRRTLAQQESQMASLEASYQQAQHSYQQAVLNQARLEFESEIQKRQEEISFQKSEMSLQRAKEAIDTQKAVNESSLQGSQARLDRDRNELEEMKAELGNTTLFTDSPGLVTYAMTWGQNGLTKVKAGDAPYSGQAIIELPDLSRMKVDVAISELDIHKIAVGQEALVQLDAIPAKVYRAKVTEVSPLASRVGRSDIKAFDCTVVLEETDLKLRPGMTAQVSIITHYSPEALQIPEEAIFRQAGETVVFALNNGIEVMPVTLGARNGSYAVVEAGLEPGMLIALRDPYIPLESLETAGMDALKQQRALGGGSASSAYGSARSMIMMMGGGGGRGMGRDGGPPH
jgi:RND family efflux transporter MFP subunit